PSAQYRGETPDGRVQITGRVNNVVDMGHTTWVRRTGHRRPDRSRYAENPCLRMDFIEAPGAHIGERAADLTDSDRALVDRESDCLPSALVARYAEPGQNSHAATRWWPQSRRSAPRRRPRGPRPWCRRAARSAAPAPSAPAVPAPPRRTWSGSV